MKVIYTREQLKSILPHREPMLLIDEIIDDGVGQVARYTIRGEEWFLQGHFPGNPIVPGVIICEMMAQSCCLLVADGAADKLTLLTGLDKVRLRHSAVPGDTMEFRCTLTSEKAPFYFAQAKATVGDKVCATANLSFVIK